MKRASLWLSGLALLVFLVAGTIFFTLNSFNHFDPVEVAFEGSCTPVTGVSGPEDIQIDPTSRRAFISSYDRRKGGERGAIYAFDIDDPLAADAWTDRTFGIPAAFEPLGLFHYADLDVSRLFVVNGAQNSIEIYDVALNGDLTHLETLSERRLTSPNDIVAVGPRAVYVTNDVEPGRDSVLGQLHFLMRAGSGRVLHFDGTSWRVAAEGLRYANGINVNSARDRLYVAETSGAALRLYDRDTATGVLRLDRIAPMGAAVDNINVDRSGALWIAAHPKPLALPTYRRTVDGRAPSLVLLYEDIAGAEPKATHVFADDGGRLSASTSAARLGSTLLIGALLEKKFLICNLPQ